MRRRRFWILLGLGTLFVAIVFVAALPTIVHWGIVAGLAAYTGGTGQCTVYFDNVVVTESP